MEQVNCSNCMVGAFKDELCTLEICDRFRKRGNCEDFERLLLNSIKHNRDNELIGKTIINAEVNCYGIRLWFDDDTIFDFDASDGGYSCWGFYSRAKMDGE